MAVDALHRDHAKHLPDWENIRDVMAGERAMKDRAGKHLSRPPGLTEKEWQGYVERATYYNATSRTVEGLLGSVFRLPHTETDIPEKIEPYFDDITLTGVPIEQFEAHLVGELLAVGRYGVLLDRGTEENARPYLRGYTTECITNWRYEFVEGEAVLRMVVLRETYEDVDDDGFGSSEKVQYRVLRYGDYIPGEGETRPKAGKDVYWQEIWRKVEGTNGQTDVWMIHQRIVPQQRGEPLERIPFQIFGSRDLTIDVDKSPILDLVGINRSHFRSSADLEHANWMTSLPTPYVTGLKANHTGDLVIGSSSFLKLPEGATVGMLEYQGAGVTYLENALNRKEAMMARLGARLLEEPKRATETAETTRLKASGESATLSTVVDAASLGMTALVRWMALWEGVPEAQALKAAIQINKEFFDRRMDPQEVTALVGAWQQGAIPTEDLVWNLQRGEIIRPGEDPEEIAAKMEQQQAERQANALSMVNAAMTPPDPGAA